MLVRSRSIPTSEQHLRLAFADLGNDVHLPAEASELAAWSRWIISRLVSRFVISHPSSLAWIAKDSQKDDAVDARKLAVLLRLNRVHEVYYQERLAHRSFKYLVLDARTIEPSTSAAQIKNQAAAQNLRQYPHNRLVCFPPQVKLNCSIQLVTG